VILKFTAWKMFENNKEEIIKLLDFPYLRQSTSYTCGVVATQTILEYYGIEYNESELAKKLETNKDGTYIDNVIDIFHKNKLKTKSIENMSIDEIKEYLDQDIPVLLMIQAYKDKPNYKNEWNYGHDLVAIGYTKNKILFSDPSQFTTTFLSNKELLVRWHEKEDEKKYINFGLAVYGKKPKFDSKKLQKIL